MLDMLERDIDSIKEKVAKSFDGYALIEDASSI